MRTRHCKREGRLRHEGCWDSRSETTSTHRVRPADLGVATGRTRVGRHGSGEIDRPGSVGKGTSPHGSDLRSGGAERRTTLDDPGGSREVPPSFQ